MQTEVLFEFVYLLIEKKCVTAKELATRFGVSTRTIYRWVDALCISGVPLYTTKGKGGGIQIEESYTLDKALLTENEKLEILASVQALNNLSNVENSNATKHSALTKLKAITKKEADWIQIDFAPWNPKGSEVRNIFENLKNAIIQKKQVSFKYFSSTNKGQTRTVQPFKIVFKGQAWYLFCFCNEKNQSRFFKLSRMKELKVLNAFNTVTEQTNTLMQNDYKDYNVKLLDIKLKINTKDIYILLDEFFIEKIEDAECENKIVTLKVPDSSWVENLILSFGENVTVLSPEKLRKSICSKIQKMKNLYK